MINDERAREMKAHVNHDLTALEARAKAQQLAFSPFMFQGIRVLVSTGLLDRIAAFGEGGVSSETLTRSTTLSTYAVELLLEVGTACEALVLSNGLYSCTKVGWFLARDALTRVNMSFAHSVCYKGLYHLEKALMTGKPAGLKELGDWTTVYEGVSQLSSEAKTDWLAFDHLYSDKAFDSALPLVMAHHPKNILDIGGNTGRFACMCAGQDPGIQLTICDLPGPLCEAKSTIDAANLGVRIALCATDLLDWKATLPKGHDAAWMSQFLCCFSKEEIVGILKRVRAAIVPGGMVFVLETFIDRQRHFAAEHALVATSLYFSAVANGNSRMYRSVEMISCIEAAGFKIVDEHDHLGYGHTLLCCQSV